MKIDRRELLLGSVALALDTAARAATSSTTHAAAAADGFYLSARNPIANTEQRDLERLAESRWTILQPLVESITSS
jgi:hypothetical protein